MSLKDINTKKILLIITFTVFLIFVLINFPEIFSFVGKILSALTPLFWGIVFAFLINLLMKKFEKLLFKNQINKKEEIKGWRRAISITVSCVTILLVIALILLLLIPELAESLTLLINNMGVYTQNVINFGNDIIRNLNDANGLFVEIVEQWTTITKSIGKWIVDVVPQILNGTVSLFGSLVNIGIGLVFAIYILYSKENLLLNLKKALYAFTPKKIADKTCEVCVITNKAFTNFVGGQFIEAIILGTLCTLGMLILQMPYAVLIGVFIGLTSLIPIFGAYIGAIPAAFLLLMENPITAVIFLIYLVILQQFESNVIYPKVVGASVGLTGLWVLLAVVIGAALGGIVGVLIGVPLFSIIAVIFKEEVAKKLNKKKLEI